MSDFDRKSGIGASTAPIIMGLAPPAWGSALSTYLWYVGELPDKETTDEMRLGNHLEAGIRDAVAERLGVEIRKPNTIQHPAIPYVYASPDGILATPIRINGPAAQGFEAKVVGPAHANEWGDDDTDEIPDYVAVQVQQQMAVFGFSRVYVAALLWGHDLRIYPINREDEAIRLILEACAEFWQRVQTRTPPEPDWTNPHTARIVQAMHKPTGIVREATVEEAATLRVMLDCREAAIEKEKQWKFAKEGWQAKAVQIMGDAGELLLPDGTSITRKWVQRAAYTVEAGSYVRFGVKYPKKRKMEIQHGDRNKATAEIASH